MIKQDKDGNKQHYTGGFNGGMQTLLRASQFKDSYAKTTNKISLSFDKFLKMDQDGS